MRVYIKYSILESDLAYKREMPSTSHLARSGYSARRERLKQEREQELARQTRLRQMAASSTGLHDYRQYQQQSAHQQHQQQHYRSTSAVNVSYDYFKPNYTTFHQRNSLSIEVMT
ncbi:unnamed protein product [Trichobilharzia regenti]|nr:unnamed protein product [Trichobilharzia regenti]